MKKLELNDKQKRKNMIDLFKLSVENSKNNFNTPDEIFFCGYQDYMQDNAIPFVYLRFRNENKLFYGEPGSIHDQLRPEVQEYLANRGYKPSDITGYKREDEYINQDYYKTGKYLDFADEEFVIKGRYFIIDVPYINQNCVVFGFWYMHKYPMELTNEIVYQVCKDNHLFDRRIFIINGGKPLIEYNSFAPGEEEIEDNTQQAILHMMSPKEKQKATTDFRNMRDKLLGKKLTMSNGQEMPMAQYNALRYVDESVESTTIPTELMNYGGYKNTPDEICIGNSFDAHAIRFTAPNAIPFTYLTMNNANKLFIGRAGNTHHNLKVRDIHEYFNDYLGDQAWILYYSLISRYGRGVAKNVNIDGRVWTNIKLDSEPNKVFSIFAFWDTDKEMVSKLTEMVASELNLLDTEIYIANGTEPYIPFKSGNNIDSEMQDNSEQHAMHLMNSKDKRDATRDFRITRDKLLGKKLTMSNGKEMPMAQYNALRYVDENVINESVDKNLEEKVRKAVRDMIKDGELPKYYGKDKAPLEMAEHYAHILKKVFGDDYKIYHTQSMEDDDICCAVIDDEFKKNGGHYDMDDCENHLESVKKWLDKIIKEEYSMLSTKKIYLTESQLSYIKKELEKARKETNTNPTEGQKKAGNYKMGRINIYGFEIAIENPKGSYRKGKDKNGKAWKCLMHNDYGYFTHTKAVDGDAVDVFLGKDLDCKTIFAIDQVINGKFDETKIMFGFKTEEEAKKAYLSNYNKGWKGLGKVTEVSIDDFKEWLYDGYKQRKPFSEYNEIKKNKLNENVDFYKKNKLLLGDDGDYVHVIDEMFDQIVGEHSIENPNTKIFFSKGGVDELSQNGEITDVLKSFDVQKQLNPKFWINGKLNSRVRLRLLDLADTFYDSMEVDWVKPKDIIMTGSLANYNWSKYSDIDLHIVVDFTDVDDRVEFVKDYFDAKKNLWNNQHEDLKIYGYPVELYVQDANEEHTASGVYSLEKDKWLKEPERDDLAAVKLDKKRIVHKTLNIVKKIEKLKDEIEGEKDIAKLDTLSEKVKKLYDAIKNMRKESLKNGSELAEGNVIFKILRRMDFIGDLIDLKTKTFDRINSIK